MKVLGLSSNYHDASSALVIDGSVVAAAAEERFTLQKHDPSFPYLSSMYCLELAGIKPDDLDYVAYYETPEVKFTRTLASVFQNFPRTRKVFIKAMHEAITSGFWIKNEISKKFDIHPKKIVYVPHHYSHAAHAFLSSPFQNAAILTVDAAGEWMCSGIFHGVAQDSNKSIEPLDMVPYPHSLGLVYSAFTAFLGFKANDGECSTMALAAFGKPKYAEQVRKIILIRSDGDYEIDASYFDFNQLSGVPVTKKFKKIFGEPRIYGESLSFDCLSDKEGSITGAEQHYADIAASIQLVLEEALLALAKRAKEKTNQANLCFSGGVALNCVANRKLVESKIFESIFIPPDPGDGGGAMGAALFTSFLANEKKQPTAVSPYLGQEFQNDDLLALLGSYAHDFKVSQYEDEAKLIEHTVNLLTSEKIVGWVQGRFENGPRALGSRSILSSPNNIASARRLSAKIKNRAAFRPYACSVTDSAAKRFFGFTEIPHLARWMQMSAMVQPEYRSQLRATMHIDGTTRPQICFREDNPRFFRLLEAFGRRSGIDALLNTSFNLAGFPIVASPVDALTMFVRTDLDAIVVGNVVVEKKRGIDA